MEKETKQRGKKLAETKCNANLTSTLNDIDLRMKNLEQSLNTTSNLNDLRSVKEALKQNNDLKKQISVELVLVSDLLKTDNKQLNDVNNKLSVDTAVKEYEQKFKALNPYLEQKQKELEVNLNLQQLLFDVDEELKWINQSKRQIEIMFSGMPQSLFEAMNLTKKQAELERSVQVNHKPSIERLIEQSNSLLKAEQTVLKDQPSANELKNKATKLEHQWSELANLNQSKKVLLNNCLNEQEKLEQLAQISLGLAEKTPIISSIQSEIQSLKDETVLNKYTVKLSQLELDLNGYKKVLNDIEKNHQIEKPSSNVERKLSETNTQLAEMQLQIVENKKQLELKQSAIEFEREATDLIQWLNEKRQKTQSEDYGQDYEHLLQLQAKFTALKDEIKVFEEPRLERIRKLSTTLLNAKTSESKQIRKRWDEIKVLRDILELSVPFHSLI